MYISSEWQSPPPKSSRFCCNKYIFCDYMHVLRFKCSSHDWKTYLTCVWCMSFNDQVWCSILIYNQNFLEAKYILMFTSWYIISNLSAYIQEILPVLTFARWVAWFKCLNPSFNTAIDSPHLSINSNKPTACKHLEINSCSTNSFSWCNRDNWLQTTCDMHSKLA